MNFNKLKEQLNSKKRSLDQNNPTTKHNDIEEKVVKKFKTRGEIEKEKKDNELKLLQEQKIEKDRLEKENGNEKELNKDFDGNGDMKQDTDIEDEVSFLPIHIVIQRLRIRKQPITYFGETHYQRSERLRLLEENEPIEYTKGENEFANILKQIEEDKLKASSEENGKSKDSEDKEKENSLKQLEQESHLSKEGSILYFLRKILWEWEESLESRSEEEKKSRLGKTNQATYLQCISHIQPLFNSLKEKNLSNDILEHVHSIIEFCKKREYVRANDEYLQMAIGNSPWPMGVTMVGIHERSSREKIFSNQVAHVLNDETQRKYIQAVKRIMTFCQHKYPTLPSKSVG